jgi:hypothetical protein
MRSSRHILLSLTLLLLSATTAAFPSLASAAGFTFSSHHTIISGETSLGFGPTFSAGSGFGSIDCAPSSFSGTSASTSQTTVNLTPNFGTCLDSLGRWVVVDNKSVFTFTDNVEGSHLDITGSLSFTATSGGKTVCTMSLAENSGLTQLGGTSYANWGGTNGILVTVEAKNLRNTTSGGFFNCGISDGLHSTGTLTTQFTLLGRDTSAKAVAINAD